MRYDEKIIYITYIVYASVPEKIQLIKLQNQL